ncbi:MAG: hypothetical protein K8S25_07395 [Alphaproteobacteria bacterium]|nr:hypothetical protein [Alphaproteobacteria bacterium]
MAKGQMRSTREKKKPKATAKVKSSGAVASDQRPLNIGAQRPGGKNK